MFGRRALAAFITASAIGLVWAPGAIAQAPGAIAQAPPRAHGSATTGPAPLTPTPPPSRRGRRPRHPPRPHPRPAPRHRPAPPSASRRPQRPAAPLPRGRSATGLAQTGFDLGTVTLVGLALLACGIGLRLRTVDPDRF